MNFSKTPTCTTTILFLYSIHKNLGPIWYVSLPPHFSGPFFEHYLLLFVNGPSLHQGIDVPCTLHFLRELSLFSIIHFSRYPNFSFFLLFLWSYSLDERRNHIFYYLKLSWEFTSSTIRLVFHQCFVYVVWIFPLTSHLLFGRELVDLFKRNY